MELITDPKAMFRTNSLLWWIGILVQSSLQTGEGDCISRGRFILNVLTMDMDIRERLESILHYCKVFVLDYSMKTWETSTASLGEVHLIMKEVSLEWLHTDDDQRPAVTADTRNCQSVTWQDLVEHVRRQSRAFLGDKSKTISKQLRLLLEEK